MANSSEWLGPLAGADVVTAPDTKAQPPAWLALLDTAGAFREAALFGDPAGAAGLVEQRPEAESESEPEPEPDAPDPLAEALALARAEGFAEGRAAAEAEGAARSGRQRALRLSFRALDEAALGVLAADLAATVAALCEGVLGEAARDPAGLLARCHEAARRIGGAAEALVLHLHPDDISLLEPGAFAGWRLAPDEALEPGSLMIEGPDGSVADGPAEWRRAIAAAVRG
jgi:flagellar assembly protein FliH